jgi:hypothetical protein
MPWIKRNLALVISGVVALALLGYGGWYLWSAIQKNQAIDGEINQAKSEIERLLGANPTPTQSNLDVARRELVRLTNFVASGKKLFPASPMPDGPLNNESFKALLETTIHGLHNEARAVGIRVADTNTYYYFTFEAQRVPVTFAPESLRPLTERLHEVQTLTRTLFKARVNHLESLRRAAVPGERMGNAAPSGADYLNAGPRTNAQTSMVMWPMEVTFRCFSPELATVLEELSRSEYAFLVKTVSVEPGEAGPNATVAAAAWARTNRTARTMTTVVNERLLRVNLRLDVVKPVK